METTDAKHILGDVEKQRGRARKALGAYWFPLVVFGGVALAGALITALGSPSALFALWIVAWPAGTIATFAYYGQRVHRIGLSAPPVPFIVTGACLGLGAFLLGWLGHDTRLGYAGPLFVIGAGYLVFARLQRSLLAGALALALMVAAIGFYLVQPPHALSLSLGLFGLASILVGALNFRQSATAP